MPAVNLASKLATFPEHWQPRTIGQFNGHDIMVAKAKGEFVWHSHPDTDDFFLVLAGRLTIEMRDGNVSLGPGDLYIGPRGSSTGRSRPRRSTCSSSNGPERRIPAIRLRRRSGG